MPRITPGSRRYRSKEEIAKDLAFILTAPVSYGTKFAVLKDAMWVWTEFNGKYEGCPYWSGMAMIRYAVNRNKKGKRHIGLRHEHIVPKRVVMEMLDSQNPATPEAVFAICEKFLIAVVITMEEDAILNCLYQSTMPKEFYDEAGPEHHDPWLRYKRCDIKWATEEATREAVRTHAPQLNLD